MENGTLYIERKSSLPTTTIELPASKSIANRALILDALGGSKSQLSNISEARDTQTMQRLLQSDNETWDVLDAGTTMRFLAAYAAVKGSGKILTGTPRMQERPIKILVDSLRELGADIKYLKKDGYPPIRVNRIKNQRTNSVQVRGDISSQYISALMMISAHLPEGLTMELTGHVGSRPYIEMTLKVMEAFGIKASFEDNIINVPPQNYQPATYRIEPDWSAASYWYSFVALSESGEILLKDLTDHSIQGDRKMADYMYSLGVQTTFTKEGALLQKVNHQTEVAFDFIHCPDMAQTIAVVCSAKGIKCKMSGLESLRIKETDRIHALQSELSKFGARLEEENNEWTLIPATNVINGNPLIFDTYHDHRMAMAFAPLSTRTNIEIRDPSVVNKSYPGFWKDMTKAGFNILER